MSASGGRGEMGWASVLDRLFDEPGDAQARAWADAAVLRGSGTPGQLRAYEILAGGESVPALLAEAPARVRRLLAERGDGVDPPAPGEWSALQVVHHVADNEAVNAVRIRSILTEDEPTVFGYDSDPWTRFYALESLDEALLRWEVQRRNTVRLVAALGAADLDRRGVLSYRGAESLRVLLAVLAGHDRDHVDQLGRALCGPAGGATGGTSGTGGTPGTPGTGGHR
jgi:hypothetical protein